MHVNQLPQQVELSAAESLLPVGDTTTVCAAARNSQHVRTNSDSQYQPGAADAWRLSRWTAPDAASETPHDVQTTRLKHVGVV